MNSLTHKFWLIAVVLMLVILSACSKEPTIDPNMLMTEIASTVQAELAMTLSAVPTATETPMPTPTFTPPPPTATATAFIPTFTPFVTPTTAPAARADNSKFLADVTVPDGTVFETGEKFTKTWRFKNTGNTTWTKDNYAILYLEGTLLGAGNVTIFYLNKTVYPGDNVEISVPFVAPEQVGSYSSYWKMYKVGQSAFGEYASIKITVKP